MRFNVVNLEPKKQPMVVQLLSKSSLGGNHNDSATLKIHPGHLDDLKL